MNPKPAIDDIADAILDGTPIDWRNVDTADAADNALVEQLKTLASVRQMRASAPTAEPSRWGHLQVFERIGQGAFGDVHRAWDPRLDREVALKLLRPDVLDDDVRGSAVIEEGRLLARVRHPNVVTIYGAEAIDGRIGLWMEFVKGSTLEQALRSGRTFTAAEVTRLGVDLCAAVAAVHAAGLVHRDIKAQNVMLDDDGRLVLMDFGAGHEAGDVTVKATAGTPLYLAPEVLSGAAATQRSDVYSIGVVLFRLLTGSYPVFGGDLADLRRAHATGDGADARLDRARIPLRLRRVLARTIDRDPDRRYAGAAMFGAALAAVQRAPTIRRVALGVVGAAALVAALAIAWNPGVRETVMGAPPGAAAAVATTPTIAVLPFVNASSDPGNDDFIDGLTSEVIRNLAVIDGLHVRSQTSSFFFKDRPRDMRQVAKQLGVAFVVEAYVQRMGNQLRISAQLVRVPDDVPVWSKRFDRTLDDVFVIQDEISLAIVDELRLTLGRGQRRYQTSLSAYDLYLRGRALVARRGESAEQAAQLFEQVIAIDPDFAPAHAGLVDAYAAMVWAINDAETAPGGMRAAAVKALQMDPDLAEAHAAMGLAYAREFDWANATSSFERAIKLNPNLSQIRTSYATTLLPLGQAAKALDILAGAVEMDPLSLAVKREVGRAQFVAGRYKEAIVNLRQVIAADPDFPYAANVLARALTFAGRPEEAIALWESRSQPTNWELWLMPAYLKQGRRADVDRLLNLPRNAHPYRQALTYAALGDKERTFEALSRAAVAAPQRTAAALTYPEMSLLRGDPRLDELRKRFNLR